MPQLPLSPLLLAVLATWGTSLQAAPSLDVVLVMDNSGSMDSLRTVDGVARYCPYPEEDTPSDAGCISGDPQRLRGPLLKSLADSIAARSGEGTRIALVSFSERAFEGPLLPTTPSGLDSLKSGILMQAAGQTNYTAALASAHRVLAAGGKPLSHQAIVFLTDGRPNLPTPQDGGPYRYQAFWDSLPRVHGIFMRGNPSNSTDLHALAGRTGGSFHSFGAGQSMDSLLSVSLLPRLLDVPAALRRPIGRVSRFLRPAFPPGRFPMDGEIHDCRGRRFPGLGQKASSR